MGESTLDEVQLSRIYTQDSDPTAMPRTPQSDGGTSNSIYGSFLAIRSVYGGVRCVSLCAGHVTSLIYSMDSPLESSGEFLTVVKHTV